MASITQQQPDPAVDEVGPSRPHLGVDGPRGPRFLKGVAVSVWQNTGDPDSNWTRYAKQKWPLGFLGVSTIRGKYNIDTNTDFWNR